MQNDRNWEVIHYNGNEHRKVLVSVGFEPVNHEVTGLNPIVAENSPSPFFFYFQ